MNRFKCFLAAYWMCLSECMGQSINPRHIKRSSLIHQVLPVLVFFHSSVSCVPCPMLHVPFHPPNHTQSSTIYPQLLGKISRSAGHGQVHETQPEQTECENFAHMTEQQRGGGWWGWVLPGNGEIVGGALGALAKAKVQVKRLSGMSSINFPLNSK